MYITIEEQLEGWDYCNKYGLEEYVQIGDDGEFCIKDSVGGFVTIYGDDLGKLIKCLQLAKQYYATKQ